MEVIRLSYVLTVFFLGGVAQRTVRDTPFPTCKNVMQKCTAGHGCEEGNLEDVHTPIHLLIIYNVV